MAFKKNILEDVPCPRCRTAKAVKKKGWIAHMFHRGIMCKRCVELTIYFYECKSFMEDKAAFDDKVRR